MRKLFSFNSLLGAAFLTLAPLAARADDAYISGAGRNYSRAGHGDFSITYQRSHTDGLGFPGGVVVHPGTTDANAIDVDVNYNITDRLSINAGLPYIIKRFQGPGAHNPATIIPPQDSDFIDDGDYHGHFQDLRIGARYLVIDREFKVEPYFEFSTPIGDYPFFAGAAPGQQLNKYEFGTSLGWYPALDDYFVNLTVGRAIVERTLGHDVDHFRVGFDAGYFVTPRVIVRGLVNVKQGGGLDGLTDFPSRTNLLWYNHDRLVKHNYVNVGGAIDWMADDNLTVSVGGQRIVHASSIFILKYAFSLTIRRSF